MGSVEDAERERRRLAYARAAAKDAQAPLTGTADEILAVADAEQQRAFYLIGLWVTRHQAAVARAEAAEAKVRAVEALADSMVWKRPEKSPCGDTEACCGSQDSCDAMQPSVKVVGHEQIRAALAEGDA